MEQFKNLKWSWEKYEEEKKQDPRIFSFETISDRDPLNRTLNEIHLSVLPKPNEYRLFKTPQEVAANTLDKRGLVGEVTDPRKEPTRTLKSASEQVKDYGYSSELTQNDHGSIIKSLQNNALHNPAIIVMPKMLRGKSLTPSAALKNKWKKEVAHFNKCAEIYYHRHITELNNLINDDMKNFLLKRWSWLECNLSEWKYQVITMLLRQKTWNNIAGMSVEFDSEDAQEFTKEFYLVPQRFFPPLHRYSIDILKLYEQQKKAVTNTNESDITISLNVLTKFFVDGSEFSTSFENSEDGTKFTNTDAVPPKSVNQVEALEEAARKIFVTNVEWFNIDQRKSKYLNEKAVQLKAKVAANPLLGVLKNFDDSSLLIGEVDNFQAKKIDNFMSKIYSQYKSQGGQNVVTSKWKIKKDQQELTLSVSREALYLDEDTPVSISIKLEFQTNFGAERMTKEELLKEWIVHKLSRNSKMLRYRVDAKTLIILSISLITIEDIEKDLKENYDFAPYEALEVLYNALTCIKNLPYSSYLIQAKTGTFHIYKPHAQGKEIFTTDGIKINPVFTRKWIQIDETLPTYIHINLNIAPCCFPISFGPHKRATSYVLPTKRKVTVAAPVVVRKAQKRNNNAKKKKVNSKRKKIQ